MLLKPYGEIFKDEQQNKYAQSYVGEVIENNDPQKLNRIKVYIELWDYMTTDEMPWVKPSGSGMTGSSSSNYVHEIPEIGSQVRVSFPSQNPDDPQYSGVEVTTENKGGIFDEDYPNTYGRKDSAGNITMTNKRTGITVYKHHSGTDIQFEKDGAVTLTMPNGSYAHCDADGTWFFKGPRCTIAMEEEIALFSNEINLNADKINLNSGFVDINAEKKINLTGSGGVQINGNSSIDLNAKKTETTGAFKAGNGCSGYIHDFMGKVCYSFNDGVMTGMLKQ